MIELPYASGRGTDSSAAYEFFHNVGKYPDGSRPRRGFCASCADMKLADIYPRSPAKVVRSAQKVPAAHLVQPTRRGARWALTLRKLCNALPATGYVVIARALCTLLTHMAVLWLRPSVRASNDVDRTETALRLDSSVQDPQEGTRCSTSSSHRPAGCALCAAAQGGARPSAELLLPLRQPRSLDTSRTWRHRMSWEPSLAPADTALCAPPRAGAPAEVRSAFASSSPSSHVSLQPGR
jgi:hypothetical protein